MVYVQISAHEVRSHLNKRLGQILAGAVIAAVANVALPETENLVDQVVLEEFHGCQYIEHGRLLHPFRQRQELSRNNILVINTLVASTRLVSVNLHHTVGGDGEVLVIENITVFVVIDYDEVVGTEFGDGNLGTVAVKELNWSVVAMLGEEGDSMLTSLDTLLDVVDLGILSNEVGLAELEGLILLLVLVVLDDFDKIIVRDLSVSVLSIILFIFILFFLVVFSFIHFLSILVVFHLRVLLNEVALSVILSHLLPAGTTLLTSLHRGQLSGVDHTSRCLLVLAASCRGLGKW